MVSLKRELSLPVLVLYGVGIILGAGIYVLIGHGAALAGNSLWLSFVVASVVAVFTGLSYAELAGMFPRTAAEYVYTKRAFNKNTLAFAIQWIMVIAVIVSASAVALGFGGYFSLLTGINPFWSAIGFLVLLSGISYIGIKESATANIIGTIVEMGGLLIVIGVALWVAPELPSALFAIPDLSGVLAATGLIFFAYLGFEELVNMSEETKNASRVVPKALIISIIVSTVLYILVAISSLALIGPEALAASSAPLTAVVGSVFPQAGMLMAIIALFSTGNTVLALLIVASRMLYGLAKNNALPSILGKIGKRRTPTVAIIVVLAVAVLVLFSGNIAFIASLTDIGTFLVYISVNAAVIALRYREPKHHRPFRSPLNIGRFPVLALLGIISTFLLLFHFNPLYIILEFGLVAIGVALYTGFGKVKSLQEHAAYAKLFRKSVLTGEREELMETVAAYTTQVSTLTQKPTIVKGDDTVTRAARIMKRNTIGSVLVVANKKTGIVTESDIIRRVVAKGRKPDQTPCKQIMSSPLITIDADKSIVEAIDIMTKKKIKKVVVMRDAHILGVITAVDIIRSHDKIGKTELRKLMHIRPGAWKKT